MSQNLPKLERLAQANLPTRWGDFLLVVFHWRDPLAHPGLSQEHVALIRGDVRNGRAVPVRIHSECLTGETFGSLRCDCSDQLKAAQQFIANAGVGVILYLRQEGRGIGLTNKIKAYALQEEGLDTIDANLKLHLPIDARQYDVAGAILHHLGVRSIRLLTNNPDKVAGITKTGIEVEERIPNWIPANQHSAAYLEVKKERMRHEIPSDALASVLPETKPNGGS